MFVRDITIVIFYRKEEVGMENFVHVNQNKSKDVSKVNFVNIIKYLVNEKGAKLPYVDQSGNIIKFINRLGED